MPKQIEFIEHGTVIDHIKSGEALKVLEVLQLIDHIRSGQCKVMIGCNFSSGRIGVKDIIKISNGFLTHRELNQISLLAPNATVSIIRNFRIIEKYSLKLEKDIHNIIACNNPNCITNMENMDTRFHGLDEALNEFQCHYCEVTINKRELKFV